MKMFNSIFNISLHEALYFCYRRCEGTFLGAKIDDANKSTDEKLHYIWATILSRELSVFGEWNSYWRPTRVIIKIPHKTLLNLAPDRHCRLCDIQNGLIHYENVFLKKRDVRKHARFLRKIDGDTPPNLP